MITVACGCHRMRREKERGKKRRGTDGVMRAMYFVRILSVVERERWAVEKWWLLALIILGIQNAYCILHGRITVTVT